MKLEDPLIVDPQHYHLEIENEWTRASFGIPEAVFAFQFSFDFYSFAERKNPLGLLRAFKKAFGNTKDVNEVQNGVDVSLLGEKCPCLIETYLPPSP